MVRQVSESLGCPDACIHTLFAHNKAGCSVLCRGTGPESATLCHRDAVEFVKELTPKVGNVKALESVDVFKASVGVTAILTFHATEEPQSTRSKLHVLLRDGSTQTKGNDVGGIILVHPSIEHYATASTGTQVEDVRDPRPPAQRSHPGAH